MGKRLLIAAIALLMFCLLPLSALAEGTVSDKIKHESGTFDPGKVGERMEKKADELLVMAKSGSVFYAAVAVIVFFGLLIAGIFSKKLLKTAFFFLFIAFVGFLILNFWSDIWDWAKRIIDWLFTEGEHHADTSGV